MDNLLLPAESAAVLLLYLIQQQPQRQLNHLDDENDETRRLCLSTHSIHLLRRAPGNRHLLDWCCILLASEILAEEEEQQQEDAGQDVEMISNEEEAEGMDVAEAL
eukprot:scaffold277411_cov14-Tisochrysis_lutea.AAC.1